MTQYEKKDPAEVKRMRQLQALAMREAKEKKQREAYLKDTESQIDEAVETGNGRLLELDYEIRELMKKKDVILQEITEAEAKYANLVSRAKEIVKALKDREAKVTLREGVIDAREKELAS